jgi:molybdenum cofactor guanylyltransferase
VPLLESLEADSTPPEFDRNTALTIAGLILDGGQGSRLGGVRKGDLRLGNLPLWQHTAGHLAPQVDTILISVAEGWKQGHRDDLVLLPDSPDGVTGPAAGLLAGARWSATHSTDSIMVSVSVDTPFFPRDFVARALPLLTSGTGCVVAGYQDRDYPTNALWRASHLLEMLASEERAAIGPRLRDVAAQLGMAICSYDDHASNPFAGINTLPDLLALSGVLRANLETV